MKGFRNQKKTLKTAQGRKLSSTRWLERHINDPFVALAKSKGYRSRAAFKLLEIDEKFKIFNAAKIVMDLGCAPGGWLQVIKQKCKSDTKVIGIDLQETQAVPGVDLIVGDFYSQETKDQLLSILGVDLADVIITDMAASSCGNTELDHLRSMALVEEVFEFCKINLKQGGHFIAKVIRGGEEHKLITEMRKFFDSVKQFKPKSSYAGSAETYFIAISKR